MKKINSSKNIIITVVMLLIIGSLGYANFKIIEVVNARSRDAERLQDLAGIRNLIKTKIGVSNKIPASGYKNLEKNLESFIDTIPQDPTNNKPYQYGYVSNNQSFVLYARMESANNKAKNDGGIYNHKPLYYEIGYGKNWQKLIPKNLP